MNENFLQIQKLIDDLLSNGFGEQYKAKYTPLSDTELKIDIEGEGVSYLIGQHGKTLLALQHIIRQMYIHQTGDFEENIKIIIDVDGYKAKRVDRIKDIAAKGVEKCRQFNREVTLPSMTAYERHVVHEFVQETYPDIITGSVGEEPNRKVVLKLGDDTDKVIESIDVLELN